MAKQKILVLTDGERVPVIGEQGKLWICEGRQFRKLSKMIQGVEEVSVKAEAPAEEAEKENNTSKKAQKKKPSTPSATKKQTNKEG